MAGRLQGKIAFLTGASVGIGGETARRFAEEGATLIIAARREGPLMETAQRIRAAGGQVTPIVLDVSDLVAYKRALLDAAKQFGRIDILVNNAMDATMEPIETLSLEGWRHAFNINVDAPFISTQAVFPIMRAQGGGAIVNVISICGLRAMYGTAAYSASKAALLHFSQVAAMEGARHGIRVNTIAPGTLTTPSMQAAVDSDQMRDAVARSIPMGRIGQAVDGANAILYLASDEAAYVTGVNISVDGGKAIELGTVDVYHHQSS
jgi:NAD(P)-dependent dehydrogenase (short-subunit alcohol dehydrogenase family)